MNDNIDLTQILKGCPKGTKLYSSVIGEVCFDSICPNREYPIIVTYCEGRRYDCFTKKGKYKSAIGEAGECILFPAKDQRSWSKFERFWDKPKVERFDPNTFEPFDKILARDNQDGLWSIEFFSHKTGIIVRGFYSNWCYAIPFNENTKHLAYTREDCPDYYKWWEE